MHYGLSPEQMTNFIKRGASEKNMKKINDIHVHLDRIDTDGITEYLTNLGVDGASRLALQSLAASPKREIIDNLVALRAKLDFKKMPVYVFGSLHETDAYKDIPYEEQIERLLALGCDGIKFLQMKPDLRKIVGKGVDHESYDKVFSILEEREIPVLMHCADPETFWDISKMTEKQIARGWYYGDGTHLSKEEHYAEVFRMLDKHPRLKLIFAHFFFLSRSKDEAVRIMEKYPNVSLDLTPGGEMYVGFSEDIEFWRDFFIKYSNRIYFGTDCAGDKSAESCAKLYELVYTALTHDESEYQMPIWTYNTVRGLNLPEDAVDKITHQNFDRLLGEPKPICRKALLSEAERMLAVIDGDPSYEASANWLKEFINAPYPIEWRGIVDSHIHIFEHVGDMERMTAEMRRYGVSEFCVQSLIPSPGCIATQNFLGFKTKIEAKAPRARLFASLIHKPPFDNIPYEVQAEELLKMGADGFKLIEMKPNVRKVVGKGVNHESFDAFFSLLEERGVPVTIHVADPDSDWDINKVTPGAIKNGWFYGTDEYMPYKEYFRETYEMLDKHPKLNVIFAHFMFLDEDYNEAVRVMEKYPCVCLDLTPHGRMFQSFTKDIDRWREFFIKYQDRIILGTDSDNMRCSNGGIYDNVLALLQKEKSEFQAPPLFRPFYKGRMKTLGLSDEVAEKIIRCNFLRLVGEEPKVLDLPLIVKSAEGMLSAIGGMEEYEHEINWLGEFIEKYKQ